MSDARTPAIEECPRCGWKIYDGLGRAGAPAGEDLHPNCDPQLGLAVSALQAEIERQNPGVRSTKNTLDQGSNFLERRVIVKMDESWVSLRVRSGERAKLELWIEHVDLRSRPTLSEAHAIDLVATLRDLQLRLASPALPAIPDPDA